MATKIHYIASLDEINPSGATQVQCGLFITDRALISDSISQLPADQRCGRCFKANPKTVVNRLKAIEELALNAEDGSIPAQDVLGIIRAS